MPIDASLVGRGFPPTQPYPVTTDAVVAFAASVGGTYDVAAELPELTFEITRADLVAYAAASGDQNPIHQDEEIALAVGLPGVIAHGMYTLALVGRAVGEWAPGAEVVELGAKFVAPVVVPATGAARVSVTGTVGERTAEGLLPLALLVTSDGTKVLGAPRATLRD